jgi:hypothetical protein
LTDLREWPALVSVILLLSHPADSMTASGESRSPAPRIGQRQLSVTAVIGRPNPTVRPPWPHGVDVTANIRSGPGQHDRASLTR